MCPHFKGSTRNDAVIDPSLAVKVRCHFPSAPVLNVFCSLKDNKEEGSLREESSS